MPEHEVYPNAPVVLVALEIRHPVAEPLTFEQRNTIKRHLTSHAPIMRTGHMQEFTVVGAVGGPTAAPEVRSEEFPRYFSRDNTTAASLRAGAIVVETTRYTGWENLRVLVANVLEARSEIGGIDGVERVGLRYIDEIRVPDGPEEGWSPWIDSTLLGPGSVGEGVGLSPSQWQGISAFEAGPQRSLVLRYGAREGFAVDPSNELRRSRPSPGPFFLMDIDSFWEPGDVIPEFDVKTLLGTCDELHAPVRTLFERLITDRLREEVLRHGE